MIVEQNYVGFQTFSDPENSGRIPKRCEFLNYFQKNNLKKLNQAYFF